MTKDRPGYIGRKRSDGSFAHYWSPQRAVKGAPPFLHMKRIATDDPLEIGRLCREWTNQLRSELCERGAPIPYNGTIGSLINHYMANDMSPLRRVKHSTRRRDYEPSLKVLDKSVGARRVDKVTGSDIMRWFQQWKPHGHRRASGAIKMLRIIAGYGQTEKLFGCADLSAILSMMRFEQPKRRTMAMTFEIAEALVRAAIAEGMASVAFTEALKFETGLRRIDVIGEWMPVGEGPMRWFGLSAGQISKDLIMTLATGKTGAPVTVDLKRMPLVMTALQGYQIPRVGPVVINEATRKPWREPDYLVAFRTVRATAGVSSEIWSMDSRAGAITETTIATGTLESGQRLATHSDQKTTLRYVRGGDLEARNDIADARERLRNVKRS